MYSEKGIKVNNSSVHFNYTPYKNKSNKIQHFKIFLIL